MSLAHLGRRGLLDNGGSRRWRLGFGASAHGFDRALRVEPRGDALLVQVAADTPSVLGCTAEGVGVAALLVVIDIRLELAGLPIRRAHLLEAGPVVLVPPLPRPVEHRDVDEQPALVTTGGRLVLGIPAVRTADGVEPVRQCTLVDVSQRAPASPSRHLGQLVLAERGHQVPPESQLHWTHLNHNALLMRPWVGFHSLSLAHISPKAELAISEK